MRHLTTYILIIFLALIYFLFAGFYPPVSDGDYKSNREIIKFSHELHVEAAECASCHTGVAESESLGDRLLPEKDNCAECHDVEDDENCELCHYEDVYEALIKKPSSLIFNHRKHLNGDEELCTECHTGLDEVEYSLDAPGANPPMIKCYSCHSEDGIAAMECEVCHISTNDLVPADHKTVSFFDNHKYSWQKKDAECAMCHDNDFCEACHIATTGIDEINIETDFYTPYSPHTYIDGSKQMVITRVHSIDYRFTHGIDAKMKASECRTCHQTETYCVTCHEYDNGDYGLDGGIIPSSHSSTNFLTIGVGSGGGEHATLAKRDIEQCASCHDTEGADPACILCHADPDGIEGTNPKTHKSGFMEDNEHGDWHDDMGSVCYNCHTDVNARPSGAAGMGFCGYCHGAK